MHNAFLLLLYPEGNALKLRFPHGVPGKRFLLVWVEVIATLHIANKGYI
jgi:hypothetical protein